MKNKSVNIINAIDDDKFLINKSIVVSTVSFGMNCSCLIIIGNQNSFSIPPAQMKRFHFFVILV